MQAQRLYDFAPLLPLLAMGVMVALGPLAWVWLRTRRHGPGHRLQALTLLTLFLTFDLVLFGAFTRLTDSGLGCPDWPGCYGNMSPSGAHAEISQAQAEMPTGPVTHGKAWVEMVHRYLATGVGFLILTLTVSAWRQRHHADAINPWWPTATLAWVCVQGVFGALTVTMKLFPAIVTLHLMGGVVLLALLCRQAVARGQAAQAREPLEISPGSRALLIGAMAVLCVQVALGGWVSTNYAVLACNEFPRCQGSWWPAMDFRQGFELWRELGRTGGGDNIHFAALTAVHYAHRLFAYVTFGVVGLLAWRLRPIAALRPQSSWLAALLLWQLATGLSNVVLGWPLAAAVGHTGGAAALVVVLTWALAETRARTAGAYARAARELSHEHG